MLNFKPVTMSSLQRIWNVCPDKSRKGMAYRIIPVAKATLSLILLNECGDEVVPQRFR